jgi:hypothetical protein
MIQRRNPYSTVGTGHRVPLILDGMRVSLIQ